MKLIDALNNVGMPHLADKVARGEELSVDDLHDLDSTWRYFYARCLMSEETARYLHQFLIAMKVF